MHKIETLANYVEIVCHPGNLTDYTDDLNPVRLEESDRVVAEFLRICDKPEKERKEDGNVETAASFLKKHYASLYSHQFRRESGTTVDRESRVELSYFYRGVSNGIYSIAPGIYRKDEQHEENYYFNEISVRCPEVFRFFGNLEKLTYMQHYGCPTRLLDITSNPLVALYFACLGDEKKDGVVYIFAVNRDEVLYANSDRIQMLSKLAEFKRNDQEAMRLLAYRNILHPEFPRKSNGKYKDPLLERYYHAIKRNNGAFEREMVPFDLLRPQFVQPNKDNPRILKQDGAFIVSGLDTDDRESDMKIRKYLVAEVAITGKNKGALREQLERVGINQATLFPEVEKVADYLRSRP